jgi:hypothetical protein
MRGDGGRIMEARIVSFMFDEEEGISMTAARADRKRCVARARGDRSPAGWRTSDISASGRGIDRRFRHESSAVDMAPFVPLRVGGETVGVVNVNNKTTGALRSTTDFSSPSRGGSAS